MGYLVYQPKGLIQLCFVCLRHRWHQHWCHLCTPSPATGLDIEASYLVHIRPSLTHIKYLVILICCLYNHALSIAVTVGVRVAITFVVCVQSSSHMVRHRKFINGVKMYTCPLYMHIKYLVILTCSFQVAAILVLFL